jgi:two-component system, NarL family, invasion response regulator UvrY
MKILIADDHAVLRKGLRQILTEEFSDAQIGEATTTPETLELLARERWDVLVLDIFMPGRTGLEVLHEVRQQQPKLPVLVLSSAPEEQLALRVLKAGASGYLNKQAAPEELVKALRKIIAGGRYVSGAQAEHLAMEIVRKDRSGTEVLSDREFTVLRMIVAGKSIKEIAGELSVSAKTVSTYHTRIWEKLGVHSDVELIHYAIAHGLAQTTDRRMGSRL